MPTNSLYPEMTATPRNKLAGLLADALTGVRDFADRARVPDAVPLLGGQGMGSMFLGKAPEEVNELSYGNLPIQINPYAGSTASYVPEMKRGRGAQVFDAISLLSLPGAKTVAGGVLGGFTPGVDAAAYLAHTPLKPNPLVGTRYKTTDLGGIAPRTPMNWKDWEGASIMTYPTDMLSRNRRIDNVSDIEIASPATSVGGLMYAADLDNIANRIGYASNAAAATSQNNRAMRAIEENLRLGGSGRVLMAPHTMPRGGENFSTTPTEVALSIMDTVNPSAAVLDNLSDMVRKATVKGGACQGSCRLVYAANGCVRSAFM